MGERNGFKTRFGLIAAIGGSVVGLGNIWRFPYMTGEYGGAAFILVYILISFIITVPIMVADMSMGRMAQTDVVNTFRKLSGRRFWGYMGYIGIISPFVLLACYCVLGGWSLHFLKEALFDNFQGLSSDGVKHSFNSFVNTGWQPVIWTAIFIISSSLIILNGVEKGIEKYNKVLMPMIVLILLGMFVHSFSMSGFSEGMSFLFKPDFSKITPYVLLQALGQSFFSLSVGMGSLITYGSYIKKSVDIGRLTTTISLTDVGVAVLSGLAIFPAIFTMGINPTSGPDLVFITLPSVFNGMPAGHIISIIFFALLFLAAVTSSVSLFEVLVTYLHDEYKMKRRKAIMVVTILVLIACTFSALSQVEGSKLIVAGVTLFDLSNNLTGSILMPIGGLLSVIFIGWVVGGSRFKKELTNEGTLKISMFGFILFLIKYVIPIFITLLFLNLLNII